MVDVSLESPWSTFCSPWLTFFTICYSSGVMRWNVYSSAVFTGGWPVRTQILPGPGWPHQPFLASENLETLGYPMVKTASLCVPLFWQGLWQTDRRTDTFAVAYTELGKLALWRSVKIFTIATLLDFLTLFCDHGQADVQCTSGHLIDICRAWNPTETCFSKTTTINMLLVTLAVTQQVDKFVKQIKVFCCSFIVKILFG